MYTIKFHTLGCKVNQYESQAMAQLFSANGFAVAEDKEKSADIYIVNSCTVTAEGDRKTRQLARKLKRENPSSVVALTGCYPQAFPEDVAKVLEVDVITGSKDRQGLVTAVQKHLATSERVIAIAPHAKGDKIEELSTNSGGKRTRAFLKIEDGCEQYCTYCIIPFARGPVRSKSLADIEQEVKKLAATGHKEIVIVGINLSFYGKDLDGKPNLVDAIKLVCSVDGIERVRLGSLEAERMLPSHIEEISKQPKFCPQFHLSLQSGAGTTLKNMGRLYTPEQYMAVVKEIRSRFENPAITTDMMVGFPQETDEAHRESVEFAKEVGFAKIHVFSYSQRSGTKAAKMPDQVPPQIKKQRSGELMAVEAELRKSFLQSMVGTTQSVLVEERGKKGEQIGYTPNYTPVSISETENFHGKIVNVLITGVEEDGCTGIVAGI